MPEVDGSREAESRLKAAIVAMFESDPLVFQKAGFAKKLAAVLAVDLADMHLAAFLGLAEAAGLAIDGAKVAQIAKDWAIGYSRDLAKELAKTMRERWAGFQERIAEEVESDWRKAWIVLITSAAAAIAATEITRAIIRGERDLSRMSKRLGAGEVAAFWLSERDGRVCPECAKRDGKRITREWPPLHVVCRCRVKWVWVP